MSSDVTELEFLRKENQKLEQFIESGKRGNISVAEEKWKREITK